MRERDVNRGCSQRDTSLFRFAVQNQCRSLAFLAAHLDIPPAHAAGPSGAQRLHKGFLRCEAGRIVWRRVAPRRAVRLLRFGENPVGETRALSIEGLTDPIDFDDIDADSNNHGASGNRLTSVSAGRQYSFVSDPGYRRIVKNGIIHYRAKALENLGLLRHGFSTRHGGVSPLPERALNLSYVSWDPRPLVDENRSRFLASLDLEPASLITLAQIHSGRVHIIKEKPGEWNCRTEGDALVTMRSDLTLAVQVADCFPVLMVDPVTRTVAAAHAGWRGALARIVAGTIGSMLNAAGSDPRNLMVAIGPGIRACCFEVGEEVVNAFSIAFPGVTLARPGARAGKFLLDLRAALQIQLDQAGIPAANVSDLEACTRCNTPEFFSYRGEGPHSGRMMGVISLASA